MESSRRRKSTGKPKLKRKSPRKSKLRGRKSKSRVRIPSRKGLLIGYHLDMPLKKRRSILRKNIRQGLVNYSETIKRLNVLVIYNKNRHPETSKRAKRDLTYIQKTFGSPKKKSLSKIGGARRRKSCW